MFVPEQQNYIVQCRQFGFALVLPEMPLCVFCMSSKCVYVCVSSEWFWKHYRLKSWIINQYSKNTVKPPPYSITSAPSGSSEGEARQAAFQDAFSKLGRLSGISEFFGTLDKADERLSDLLKMAGQGEPVSSLKAQQYKASVQLKFTDYKLEHKSNTNKKQARNYLSERILKILGVDTGEQLSV